MTVVLALAASAVFTATAFAQTPQPFPRPAADRQTQAPAPAPAAPAVAAIDPAAPGEAVLGVPVHPTAQFIASYDAGRGQRYYIFGATAPFAELVTFYRTALRERGNQVFNQPLTHIFEVGRFREDSMAFPPSVTVKDWTSGGSAGYPNPKGDPERFPTILMIVPAPPAAARN